MDMDEGGEVVGGNEDQRQREEHVYEGVELAELRRGWSGGIRGWVGG